MSIAWTRSFLGGMLLAAALLTSAARGEQPSIELAPLAKPVTVFGAAVAGDWLYVYGGHYGAAHKYHADDQGKELLRLNLANPGKWETVSEGPRRTGVALVAYEGKLYRIGGWEARNTEGEKWDLYSQPDFARFDPATKSWTDLAPLPRGRSSHDAALLGSKVYVIGGWELQGEGSGDWHTTAYVCDLAAATPEWKEIAKPPFMRRALAVATHAGKVYAIGGMNDSNEMTTEVDIYDPQSDKWSKGPKVPGEDADGFGVSAIGTESGLFASTRSGGVYALEGESWKQVGKLSHPRFFHRLVDGGNQRLIAVGGTARGGKIKEVESLRVAQAAAGE